MGFDYKMFLEELFKAGFIRTQHDFEVLLETRNIGLLIGVLERVFDQLNSKKVGSEKCPVCHSGKCDGLVWHDYYVDTKHSDFQNALEDEFYKHGFYHAHKLQQSKIELLQIEIDQLKSRPKISVSMGNLEDLCQQNQNLIKAFGECVEELQQYGRTYGLGKKWENKLEELANE